MSIKLYHCAKTRSLRPLWTLEEMDLDYQLITLPFPPRTQRKDFREINPLMTVPCLVDGEVRMTESSAICQYLVERYGPTPLAVSPTETDYPAYLNWLYHSDATLTFPLTLVFRYAHLEPKARRQPQVVDDYKAFFLGRLRLLEGALADREYLCSGRFTIADICVGYALVSAQGLGINEAFASPQVEAYWQRISARGAYQRAIVE